MGFWRTKNILHQLFISSMGTYVVVINGSININFEIENLTSLPGYEDKKTSAGIGIDLYKYIMGGVLGQKKD